MQFESSRAIDHFSASWFSKDGTLYQISSSLEAVLRSTILLGEGSSDPGGLEARWLIKMAIPLGFLFVLLQSLGLLLIHVKNFRGR